MSAVRRDKAQNGGLSVVPAPVTIEEKPKEFVERAIQQIWFAGGLIAMTAVCVVGFGIGSFLICLPFALVWWLLKDVTPSGSGSL